MSNYYYENSYYNPYGAYQNVVRELEKWSKIPYPGQVAPYVGVEPSAGTWSMNYFKGIRNGMLIDKNGRGIKLDIKDPRSVDFHNELKEVQYVNQNVTEKQKDIAKYWAGDVPVATIGPTFIQLVKTYNINPVKSSRMLDGLSKGLNDAFVITWYLKYYWDVARPNQLDRNLVTIVPTPQFPSYPSGHSVVSAATSEIMSFYFPGERNKLFTIAEEASMSRLFGGVHFMSDLTEGVRLGKQIGALVVEQIKRETDSNGNPIDLTETVFLDAPIMPKY